MELNTGQRVRITTDPGRIGIITGRTRERGGVVYHQVQFTDGLEPVRENLLEPVGEDGGDPLDLLERGRLARAGDLRRTLTHARLTGRLANVIYSMDTTGADFYAYQFKPLVKLLNGATTGILIADEVGLGKTIEAGLIWTELQSRFDYARVLVLCPAMLRKKWQRELRIRFGVEAEIVDAAGLHEQLRRAAFDPDTTRFAVIASLQGVRPRRRWEEIGEDERVSPVVELARLLDRAEHDAPLVDLLVIDEAHYLRNPGTMTSELGRLARGVSEYLLLLSATPVHLRSGDLYQLVHLADPATFNRPQTFDDLLEANAPLVEARDLVAGGGATQEQLREILIGATENRLLRGSRQLELLLGDLPDDDALRQAPVISELTWRLENVNLLGHVVTRTRKRDVKEWRVVREAHAHAVPLTEVESEFYATVTRVVREYCARAAAHEGFLLVMPQRQMSSSMPAALRAWKDRQRGTEEQLDEDLGSAVSQEANAEEPGPLVQELISRAHELGDYDLLRQNDSKYERLRTRLKELNTRDADAKVVLFSYFRPTLAYLRERLIEDGLEILVLHGGTDDKDAVIDEFRRAPGGSVMLCSEVASEGIDLQFSWIVINYDLPWNPMKVEQRIGRLDRLGQESDKVLIWNLFYDNTIDSRIYERLYQRLNLFERTLGALEPVLGDVIRELALDLLRQDLSADQEEERIDQTRIALENKRAEEERLEEEAAHLVAYGDYIVNQVNAARELSRRIEGNDLRVYVMDFFRDHYPGCDFRQQTDDLEFDITLSSDAKHSLEGFLRERRMRAHTRLARVDSRQVRCRFDNTVVRERTPRAEVINQLHPLVRFVGQRLRELDQQLRPAVAVLLASGDAPEAIAEGTFVFSVQRWSMRGLRETEYLHFAAVSLVSPDEVLEDEEAERLVTVAAAKGKDWLSAETQVDLEQVADLANRVCLARSDGAYESRVDQLRAQNEDRAQIQERTLEQHSAAQRRTLEEVLERHRSLGRAALAAATEGKIRALTERMELRRREIEERRLFEHRAQEICVGIIRVGNST